MGTLINGLRLRRRLSGLVALDATSAGSEDSGSGGDFVLLCAPGVVVSDSVRATAIRYVNAEDLDVVDLVPADLGADQVLQLARDLNAATYRSSPLASGRGARHALLVRRSVAERAPAATPIDRAALVRLTERLKQCAARSTDLVVTDWRGGGRDPASERLDELDARYGSATALALPAA